MKRDINCRYQTILVTGWMWESIYNVIIYNNYPELLVISFVCVKWTLAANSLNFNKKCWPLHLHIPSSSLSLSLCIQTTFTYVFRIRFPFYSFIIVRKINFYFVFSSFDSSLTFDILCGQYFIRKRNLRTGIQSEKLNQCSNAWKEDAKRKKSSKSE